MVELYFSVILLFLYTYLYAAAISQIFISVIHVQKSLLSSIKLLASCLSKLLYHLITKAYILFYWNL